MNCPICGEAVEELQTVRAGGKKQRACEDCADRMREDAEIAEDASLAMRGMMEYKGGRR